MSPFAENSDIFTEISEKSQMGGTVMATRKQFPLNLAWALSIHKSQGMTIPRVIVSMENIFEAGQVKNFPAKIRYSNFEYFYTVFSLFE